MPASKQGSHKVRDDFPIPLVAVRVLTRYREDKDRKGTRRCMTSDIKPVLACIMHGLDASKDLAMVQTLGGNVCTYKALYVT